MRIVTPQEMNRTDVTMSQTYATPTSLLMENAGRAVATYLSDNFSNKTAILFITGSGNNGGDGWAAARMLFAQGYNVKILSTCAADKMRDCTLMNFNIADRLGINYTLSATPEKISDAISSCDVIVDALLGTGISGEVKGAVAEIISIINNSGKFVLSVDVPSGINATDGSICGSAIKSNVLITLGAIKEGLLYFPAKNYYNKLIVENISIPDFVYEQNSSFKAVYNDEEIASMLMHRSPSSHKGTFGKLGIIAGSRGMTGAAVLSASAATRSGAGIIELAVPQSLNTIFEIKLTEQITKPMPENEHAALISSKELIDFCDSKSALVIGPGLSLKSEGNVFIPEILNIYNKTVVIDADGLNLIVKCPNVLKNGNTIITPHIGEMARLTGRTVNEVAASQGECALTFAKQYNTVVVLKNYITTIASPDGRLVFNTTGNSGMATGGSGDVLSGIIGSLATQGYDAFDAAVIGAYINGKAADIAAEMLGNVSLMPSDTANAIANVFMKLYSLKV